MGDDNQNSYAQAARARKVQAFVQYLDQRFISVGRCPYREAGELAEMLRDSVSEEQWAHHAVQAGQNKPSATTVAEIINVYERRAEERAEKVPQRRVGTLH